MQKLTYTNDDQFVADAAQMLISEHLSWSGSHEHMPSKDLGYVRGKMIDAYLDANYTVWDWDDLSAEERIAARITAEALYNRAVMVADAKWREALRVLGIAA